VQSADRHNPQKPAQVLTHSNRGDIDGLRQTPAGRKPDGNFLRILKLFPNPGFPGIILHTLPVIIFRFSESGFRLDFSIRQKKGENLLG